MNKTWSVLASTSRAVCGVSAVSSPAPLQRRAKRTSAKDRPDVIDFPRLSAVSGKANNNVEVCGEFVESRRVSRPWYHC